jgi:hypothetical protein
LLHPGQPERWEGVKKSSVILSEAKNLHLSLWEQTNADSSLRSE